MASAIAEGCTDSPDKIVGKFEDIYNSQIAGVVAQAITDVSTTYETEGARVIMTQPGVQRPFDQICTS